MVMLTRIEAELTVFYGLVMKKETDIFSEMMFNDSASQFWVFFRGENVI